MALDCGLTATGNRTLQGRQGCGAGDMLAGLGGYEGSNPMLGLAGSGRDLESLSSGFSGCHEGRATIDLMQMHHGSHGSQGNGIQSGMSLSGGQYSRFSSLRPFESSIYTSQQLL